MRVSKPEEHARHIEIKEQYLKGIPTKEIAKNLSISITTAEREINKIQNTYQLMAQNNIHIVSKQFERLSRLLDEVSAIQKEFWATYEQIKQREIKEIEEYNKMLEDYKIAFELRKNEPDLEKANKIDIPMFPKKPKPQSAAKINALKEIMSRIEKEAKLLNLFNPKIDIHQTITINDLKLVLNAVRDIIIEFVPSERQETAMKRLMGLKIKEDSIDAQIVES